MSASTILTSKRGFVRSSAFLAASLAFAAALPMSAVAEIQKTNPVTGETENYTWKFVGTDTWNGTQYWQNSDSAAPAGVPAKSGDSSWGGSDDQWLPILFDGNTIQINAGMSVEGWNLRMGLYNGANITLQHLVKLQSGVETWFTVDENSTLTIAGMDNNKLEGSNPLCLYSARANGITWTPALSNSAIGNGVQMPLHYYLAGDGSVAFNGGITLTSAQIIKRADVTLSEATSSKTVRSKMLVSFASSSTSTFTADATIKVKNDDGSALKDVNLTSVTATDTTLTTAGNVGDCELVQTTTGILLFYVDYAKTYKPSININFTNGADNGLTTGADVGLTGYAVPGASWNNYVVANSTFGSVNAIDSTGAASAMSGVSVTVSGTRGSWSCSSLVAASNPLHGYIDEESGANSTPTVTVTGIPYYKYRVLVYHSTDTADVPFGYDTINGTNYTYVEDALSEGTTAWGNSGAKDSANAIAEGSAEAGNVLVTEALSGSTLTVVGHRAGGASNARGCIAAIQIIEVKADVGENDLLIVLDGDETYTFDEAKTYDTVYVDGSGTLTFDGTASTATTLNVSLNASVNMVGSSLSPTTVTGFGTAVYDGALPTVSLGWTDSAKWGGTVWIKNYATKLVAFDTNPYGNAGSTLRLTGLNGYFQRNSTVTHNVPIELVDDGDTVAWTYNDGWGGSVVAFATLKGNGTFKTGSAGNGEIIYFANPSSFKGSFSLEMKKVVLGGDVPGGNNQNYGGKIVVAGTTAIPSTGTWTAGAGIEVTGAFTVADNMTMASALTVAEGGTLTVVSGKTLTVEDAYNINGTANINGRLYSDDVDRSQAINGTLDIAGALDAQGDIVIASTGRVTVSGKFWANYGVAVDGKLSTSDIAKISSETFADNASKVTVNAGGVLEMTSTDNTDDRRKSYANVSGTGTVRFAGSGWRALPDGDNMFPSTLAIEVEQAEGVVCAENNKVIGSVSGTKNLRSDLDSSGKTLTIKQAKDGVWSGAFEGGGDRLETVVVDPGASTTGTLTLAGTHTHDNKLTINGSVNLTGTWKGAVTVTGTFGGKGTIDGNLTVNGGCIFAELAAEPLKVTGDVVFSGAITIVYPEGTKLSDIQEIIKVTGTGSMSRDNASFTVKAGSKVIGRALISGNALCTLQNQFFIRLR